MKINYKRLQEAIKNEEVQTVKVAKTVTAEKVIKTATKKAKQAAKRQAKKDRQYSLKKEKKHIFNKKRAINELKQLGQEYYNRKEQYNSLVKKRKGVVSVNKANTERIINKLLNVAKSYRTVEELKEDKIQLMKYVQSQEYSALNDRGAFVMNESRLATHYVYMIDKDSADTADSAKRTMFLRNVGLTEYEFCEAYGITKTYFNDPSNWSEDTKGHEIFKLTDGKWYRWKWSYNGDVLVAV